MSASLLSFQGIQEPLLVRRAGSGGIEYPGALRRERLHQAADQFAASSALHRRHPDNHLWFAVLRPAPANRRNQAVEIGTRRRLLAGELSSRDRVSRLTEGHDFALEVRAGKSLRHVFRQGPAEGAHAFEPDRTAIVAVWSGREEEQLSA